MNCKVCQFLKNNQEYETYINNNIRAELPLEELIYEFVNLNVQTNFNTSDLEHHKRCIEHIELIENAKMEETSDIDITQQLQEFKTKNPLEQSALFDELLKETSFKILNIINEKLNIYKDKVPKDDIQAFKTLYDLSSKTEVENILNVTLKTKDDRDKYSHGLINNLIKSKYLSRENSLNLIKLLYDKNIYLSFSNEYETSEFEEFKLKM